MVVCMSDENICTQAKREQGTQFFISKLVGLEILTDEYFLIDWMMGLQ